MKELEKLIYNRLIEENEVNNPYLSNNYSSKIDRTYLDIIENNMNNSSIKPFLHKGIIGKIKIFIKKVIRKLTKFYLEPFATQQTQFNVATYRELDKSAKENQQLSNKVHYLENESLLQKITCDNINDKTNTLTDTVTNISKKYEELNNSLIQLNNENKHLKDELLKYSSLVNSRLLPQSFNPESSKVSYSQSGEDSIIKYILFSLNKIDNVTYLDIGANHAKELSNTYCLYEAGASGVLVEANPRLITELELYRNRDIIINKCISAIDNEEVDFYIINGDGLSTADYEGAQNALNINNNLFIKEIAKVNTISINTIINKYFVNRTPEVVSIDIEGKELEVLQQIDFDSFRPLIYVIETIPYKNELVINDKTNDIITFMNNNDYTEYAFTGINSIFVDNRQVGVQR